MSKKGYKQTEEHKINTRKARIYKPLSTETKRKISIRTKEVMAKIPKEKLAYWKGKKMSAETRRKMSENSGQRGEKNCKWKGGITPENQKIRMGIEIRLWREAVFARDNWTCQKCFIRGGELQAHHIKPFAKFPEMRTSIENGLTLCKKCHRAKGFHK